VFLKIDKESPGVSWRSTATEETDGHWTALLHLFTKIRASFGTGNWLTLPSFLIRLHVENWEIICQHSVYRKDTVFGARLSLAHVCYRPRSLVSHYCLADRLYGVRCMLLSTARTSNTCCGRRPWLPLSVQQR